MRPITLISIIFLAALCRSQPISMQDLASKIQVSDTSSSDDLVAAAVAWSITDKPTDSICDFLENVPVLYSVLRASALAKCHNVNAETLPKPEHLNDLFHAIMMEPKASQFKALLSFSEHALQHEKYIIVHAGSFILSKNPDLKNSKESKQILDMYNNLVQVSSKDLLRFGDEHMSSLQKVKHLGSSAYLLWTLDLVKPAPELFQKLAEVAVGESFARSAEDIASIMELANSLLKISYYVPVICDTVSNKDGMLSLKATDILGKPAKIDSVELVSCRSSQGSSLALAEQSNSDGIYILKFDLKSAHAGVYSPIVKIKSQGHDIIYNSPKMTLSVYAAIELPEFKAWTSSKLDDSISSITATFPNASEDVLEISSPSTHLHFNFRLNSNLDDIAYIGVALVNMDSNKHVVLTPTKQTSGNYKLKLKYTHSIFSRRVPGNGRYQIKLLVSDPAITDFVDWTVCEATINLLKLPGAVRLVSDFVHMKKPTNEYPSTLPVPKMANVVWMSFSALMVIPLFGLLWVWYSQRLNLAIDKGPGSIAFQSLQLTVFLTFSSYWMGELNIFQLTSVVVLLLWLLL